MSDEVQLRGIRVLAHIGVTAEERNVRQTIQIDLDLEADQTQAGLSDDLNDAVDYEQFCDAIEEIADHQQFALIEKMAQTVVTKLFDLDKKIDAMSITLTKLVPPVHAEISTAAVHFYRVRP